jgi:outer membrane receptor for ferrienterochelin and colicins
MGNYEITASILVLNPKLNVTITDTTEIVLDFNVRDDNTPRWDRNHRNAKPVSRMESPVPVVYKPVFFPENQQQTSLKRYRM